MEAGVPFTLPVRLDECFCVPETMCSVEVDPSARVLRLTTRLCPDDPDADCDRCTTAEASCAIPALAEGQWNVVSNGSHAFFLNATSDDGPTAPMCDSYSAPDVCAVDPERPPIATAWSPSVICANAASDGERTTISLLSQCWPCGGLDGTCRVRFEPRFTADLPPGGELYIEMNAHTTSCDVDCPDICIRAERVCEVPPLTPGEFYRVWDGGVSTLSFIAGELSRVCAGEEFPG